MDGKKLNIFYLEDSELWIDLVKEALQSENINFYAAETEAAFARWKKDNTDIALDVVITDMNLEDKSLTGVDVFQKIFRAELEEGNAPMFIVFSNNVSARYRCNSDKFRFAQIEKKESKKIPATIKLLALLKRLSIGKKRSQQSRELKKILKTAKNQQEVYQRFFEKVAFPTIKNIFGDQCIMILSVDEQAYVFGGTLTKETLIAIKNMVFCTLGDHNILLTNECLTQLAVTNGDLSLLQDANCHAASYHKVMVSIITLSDDKNKHELENNNMFNQVLEGYLETMMRSLLFAIHNEIEVVSRVRRANINALFRLFTTFGGEQRFLLQNSAQRNELDFNTQNSQSMLFFIDVINKISHCFCFMLKNKYDDLPEETLNLREIIKDSFELYADLRSTDSDDGLSATPMKCVNEVDNCKIKVSAYLKQAFNFIFYWSVRSQNACEKKQEASIRCVSEREGDYIKVLIYEESPRLPVILRKAVFKPCLEEINIDELLEVPYTKVKYVNWLLLYAGSIVLDYCRVLFEDHSEEKEGDGHLFVAKFYQPQG